MSTSNQFSLLKGYSFKFQDGDNVIEPWFSSLTGLEEVKVNGQIVARQRNLSTNSTNHFEIEDAEYGTNLQVSNLFKGPFVCTLFKHGEVFKQQRLVFPIHEVRTP